MKGCSESGIGEGGEGNHGRQGQSEMLELKMERSLVANASTIDGLGIRYGAFGGWVMAAEKVEVFLVVHRYDVERCRSLICQQVCQYQGS